LDSKNEKALFLPITSDIKCWDIIDGSYEPGTDYVTSEYSDSPSTSDVRL